MKEKSFENYLEKNSNLSESTLSLRAYGYNLISKYVDLDSKIKEFKKSNDPDEEMEELLQEWVNHLVKNPPNEKQLIPSVLRVYANSVIVYLSYHRFRVNVKNLKFPKSLKEETHPITIEEIQRILKAAKWIKQGYYLCLISTGARPREILGLEKSDVKWMGDKFKAIIPAKLTKKGLSRTVYFSKECTPYLNALVGKEGKHLFPHNENRLNYAITNEGSVFQRYLEKSGLEERQKITTRHKITLYSFRRFFFTKALDHFKDDIAHALTGHGGYLQVYQSRTEEEKKAIWDKLEPEILIYDQSKKEQKIKDLEVALEDNNQLEERLAKQEKQMKELMDYAFKKIE